MSYYKGPKSDHFDGEKFFIKGRPFSKDFFDFLKWRLSSRRAPWPSSVENIFNDIPPGQVLKDELRVSFVGHSTFLIQFSGLNILTDPVWSNRASPFPWMGPKRVHAPGIRFENLPKINIILLSHNHYDHLDIHTLRKIYNRDRPIIMTPLGNDNIIKNLDKNIQSHAYDWGEGRQINNEVEIILEPVQHWSARGIFDRNHALWGAFCIKTSIGNIVFLGDCGYGDGEDFKKMKEKYGTFRLALIPIGAYKPEWFMQYAHMSPHEAITAFKDLGASYAVPMHHSTFPLADDGYTEALDVFHEEAFKRGLNTLAFKPLKIGEHWMIPHPTSYDDSQEVLISENIALVLTKLRSRQVDPILVRAWLDNAYLSCKGKIINQSSDRDLVALIVSTLDGKDIKILSDAYIDACLEFLSTSGEHYHQAYGKWKDFLDNQDEELLPS